MTNSVRTAPALSAETRRHMLGQMLDVRTVEARIQDLFLENVIRGTTHLCDGQEAVSVGMAHLIDAARGDTVTCTYRGHGHAVALGMTLRTLMAEMMGKAEGCSKGKGGSMHLTDMNLGLIGTFAIIGAGLVVTNGAALTAQITGSGAVAVALFGDGTSNIGTFHEALNLAAVWKLPSIFICENNLYGEYSAYDETAPVPNVADRALAYNMPSQIVDGQDVEAVVEAIQHATDRARNGGGPTLIEAKTYRYRGHSRSDNAPYRKPGELDEWLQRDPIHILAQRMIADGQLTEAEFAALKQRSADAVEDATTWAMSLPDPVLTSALEDIWA